VHSVTKGNSCIKCHEFRSYIFLDRIVTFCYSSSVMERLSERGTKQLTSIGGSLAFIVSEEKDGG
jgi:hypothetical protein